MNKTLTLRTLIAVGLLLWFAAACDDTVNSREDARALDGDVGFDTRIDGNADVPADLPDGTVDTVSPDVIEPDVGPTPICAEAYAHVDACPELEFTGQFDLNWPGCNPRDACAAECALDASCAEMMCDFGVGIDCDGWGPVEECLATRCDDIEVCLDNQDCAPAHYDCCAGQWMCGEPDGGCLAICDPPIEPAPECVCDNGSCEVSGQTTNMCTEAYERWEQCGYDIEVISEILPGDAAQLRRLQAGVCSDPMSQCYMDCIYNTPEDPCMECHFSLDIDCFRDPFGECTSTCDDDGGEPALCEQTGGRWGDSDCENCCGPNVCGEPDNQPCPLACCGPPQCYCPATAPFWSQETGCYDSPACYP